MTLLEQIFPFPAELTTEIFQHAISVDFKNLFRMDYLDEGHSESYALALLPVRDRLTTPLTLGAVCRSWRSFVWSIPSLWSIIVLNVSIDRGRAQLDILELWLSKSKTNPLRIFFDWTTPSDVIIENDTIPKSALEMIVEQSERWEEIDIGVAYLDDTYLDILKNIRGRIPILQRLHTRLGGWGHFNIDMFETAPLLRVFSLSKMYFEDITALPWLQLTSFTGCIFNNECIDVLTRCIDLRECHLINSNAYTFTTPPADIDHLTLPHLRELSTTYSPGHTIKSVVERITSPALRELRLSTRRAVQPTSFPFSEMVDMIERSQCPLETLDLESDYDHNVSFMLPTLVKLSGLQKLKLRIRQINSEEIDCFLDELLPKLDDLLGIVVLPQLAELHYATPNSVNLGTCTHLLKIIGQRSDSPHGIARLRKVFIDSPLVFSESERTMIRAELGRLTTMGMQITMTGLRL